MASRTAYRVTARTGGRATVRPLRAVLAGALVLLTAATGYGAGAGSAHADPVPTPLPSADATAPPAIRLPVIPSRFEPLSDGCVRPSATVVPQVPWAESSLGLGRARQLASGAGVTVAVVDSGVSRKAPALAGRVTAAGAAGADCLGHGTFVAGLIAAAPAPGGGFGGVAPDACVLAVRGLAADGTPDEAAVAAGIRAAADAGAQVIDVSLAFPRSTRALDDALRHAAAKDALVVAAATPDDPPRTTGGDGEEPPPVAMWPAARSGVLSVVDVDVLGDRPEDAARPVRADLAAPGVGVTGIGPSGRGNYLGNGPSVAAAFTAGAAALLRSYRPDLTAPEVAARLTASAYPAPVPRLDPFAALSASGGSPASAARPSAGSAISLHVPREDPAPGRRATLITCAALLIALVLGAASLLRRRTRAATAREV
ncbi:S8 family serine peptidase [Streptomyces sp. J2-1]|uniref:S8 family serine peptidase n=1 Tax=Streptomyces corallincola TaxID=2851888 RepID=UPI001C39504C|nr:S8 family serine peptidase [Streptomyces corallincola]MBV2354901.1 S8 family serine peptidase [Streptomyces corallincola]